VGTLGPWKGDCAVSQPVLTVAGVGLKIVLWALSVFVSQSAPVDQRWAGRRFWQNPMLLLYIHVECDRWIMYIHVLHLVGVFVSLPSLEGSQGPWVSTIFGGAILKSTVLSSV
jgi:hypothetical protein